MSVGNINHQQVLHAGGAKLSAGITLGEIGGRLHLIGRDPPSQNDCTHIGKPTLLLRMDADVIAIDIVRRALFRRWIKLEPDAVLQFIQETLRSPAMA